LRVSLLDHANLPGPVPFLDPPLALESRVAGFVNFIPDQDIDAVLSCETLEGLCLVL
jgi:hypothetical protein